MDRVIRIIALMLFLSFIIVGCGEKKKETFSHVPEKIEMIQKGLVQPISARTFIDSINGMADINLYFLHDPTNIEPVSLPPVPGMVEVSMGDMFYVAETLDTKKPLFLISLYGSDSKRMCDETASRGIDSYFLVGGTYQLSKEMNEKGWKFIPRPAHPHR